MALVFQPLFVSNSSQRWSSSPITVTKLAKGGSRHGSSMPELCCTVVASDFLSSRKVTMFHHITGRAKKVTPRKNYISLKL